jgi:diaminopimelate decarboxylase
MKRLPLFPITTTTENDDLMIAGHSLQSLAEEHGTPLYIYDRATMDLAARQYGETLASYYPGPASVTYAGKAFLCTAITQWTQGHGLFVDCTGEGEIAIAVAGNVPREKVLVHGVNKSKKDLECALEHANTIVVDNLAELERLSELLQGQPADSLHLWLRLLPGLAVDTHHAHTQTGQHESKFGMTREEILEAAQICSAKDLPLKGIHFHQGSNFRDPEPLIPAIEMALDLAKEIGFSDDWDFCPGGGWGVAYHEDELPTPSIEGYVSGIAQAVVEGCQTRGLDRPHLHLEPGRSLVARAGVAVYRVGATKKRGPKTWLLTDGGMADNPRHALYGARYSCLPVREPGREERELVSIAGPYCESGDVVIEDLPMPAMKIGDLIAIPVAGAYHLSMSSNYNGARRPAVLWLEVGKVQLIMERETTSTLSQRDHKLS